MVTVLVACSAGGTSETPTTAQTEARTSAPTNEALDETSAELSESAGTTDREPETIPDEPVEESTLTDSASTEEDTAPAAPEAESEDLTEEMTLESTADETADGSEDMTENISLPPVDETTTEAETLPPEPEETQPGKLVYVSNDELRYLNNMGEEIGCAYEAGGYDAWTNRSLIVGKDQVAVFVDWGWAAFDSTTYEFGYVVNGSAYFSEGYAREAEVDVVAAATQKGAKNCARYCGGLTSEGLVIGDNHVQFCVKLDGDVLCVLREYTVTLTQNPVRLDGSFWLVEMELWEVSGHKKGITSATDPSHGGMVKAGGVERGALLHQGSIGIGTVDLSKYEKIIVYYGCDASAVTQGYYNESLNNRIMLTTTDMDGRNSPDASEIIAYEDYALYGWTPFGLEIDLTGINYKGPVYISVDTLPGTFMLITAIELIGSGKDPGAGGADTPVVPADKDYAPALSDWEVSGHKPGITIASDPTHGGMVAAGGVSEGALLHQGAVGVGTVDLSKYRKVIVYCGCDASGVTQSHYNASENNRVILSTADTDGRNSPDAGEIIAATTYTLHGWSPEAVVIDLKGINYNGPVYISVDTLPGTFMLVTAIEFVV